MKLILIAVILISFSCKENNGHLSPLNNYSDTTPTILLTGIPEIEQTKQMNVTAKQYGFRFKSLGCVTGLDRRDSIKRMNERTYSLIDKRLGNSWRAVYYAELEMTTKIREFIYEFLTKNHISFPQHLYTVVLPWLKKEQYLVQLYTVDFTDTNIQYKTRIYIGIDFNKKKGITIRKAAN